MSWNFTFTPIDVQSIQLLMDKRSLLARTYKLFSTQDIFNCIEIVEIIIVISLVVGLLVDKVMKLAGLCLLLTFALTLSFLIITPVVWKPVDVISVSDSFIVKDLAPYVLGIVLFRKVG